MTAALYLRADEQLPPEAVRDLEAYFAQLRAYYGIPADQPVFPQQRRRERKPSHHKRATGRNAADHPWRNTL